MTKTPLSASPPAQIALSGGVCQCSGCGESFNSVHAFDSHRTGEYSNAYPYGRRCLTTEEMLQSGMGKNINGRWVTEIGQGRFSAPAPFAPPHPLLGAGPNSEVV